jgi:hypothetical protein
MPDTNEEGPIDPPADRFGLDRPTLGDPSASNPDGSAQNNRGSIRAFEWGHLETSPFIHLRMIPDRALSLWLVVATLLNIKLCDAISIATFLQNQAKDQIIQNCTYSIVPAATVPFRRR